MARQATAADAAERASGGLDYTDIPARLRPSSWRWWLDQVNEVPVDEDEREAAYGGEDRPNPFTPPPDPQADMAAVAATAALLMARLDPAPHWRQIVSDERHQQGYLCWLAEHGLLVEGARPPYGLGDALPGWKWSQLEQWERQQAGETG